MTTRFELAVATGHWQIEQIAFPVVDVQVFRGDASVGLRLDVTDYPARAPAGRLWDLERGVPLDVEYWPTGRAASAIFRQDWSPQHRGALYMPLDRIALETHGDWAGRFGAAAWSSSKTIYDYLTYVHRVLRDATIPPPPTP